MSNLEMQRKIDRNRVICGGQGRRFNDTRSTWIIAVLRFMRSLRW